MIIPTHCPKCKAHFEGQPIQDEERALARTEGSSTRWTKLQIVTTGSRATHFKCHECEHEWPIHWLPKSAEDIS